MVLSIKLCFLIQQMFFSTIILGFPGGSADKESACNEADLSSILGWGDPLEIYPLQYSSLENSMDCIDYGVAKSWT